MLNLAKQVWTEEHIRGIGAMTTDDDADYGPTLYTVLTSRDPTTVGGEVYGVRIVELPGCQSQGDSVDEALEMIADAFREYTRMPGWQQKD